MIAEVMEAVGKDGAVTVEEGQGLHLESEVVEGFSFDKGFVSPYMVTDTTRMEASFNKPAIVITDKKISNISEISPLMESLAQAGKKDMVLIAEDVEGEALTMLVLNKLKGVFNTVAVKAPSFGDRRKEILQDIAILTGGQVISEEQGHSFDSIDGSFIGSARKVLVTKDGTTIVEGGGKTTAVKARIEQINAQIKTTTSDYDRTELQKRRASLSGKVAVIKVGGASETEIEEKKYRVDDAVAAVKAAMSEGVVAGGGVTLVNLAGSISKQDDNTEDAGAQLLARALEQPFRILMQNSGLNADEWLPQVRAAKAGMGVNVNDPKALVDMKKVGVVDPVLVTKQAVQNATSIAGTGMTMGALVVDIPEPKATTPDMGASMGMM
jgi:chaperonin GroEL